MREESVDPTAEISSAPPSPLTPTRQRLFKEAEEAPAPSLFFPLVKPGQTFSEIDAVLGSREGPLFEIFFSVIDDSFATKVSGPVALRYTLDSGKQVMVQIVKSQHGAPTVLFSDPGELLFATNSLKGIWKESHYSIRSEARKMPNEAREKARADLHKFFQNLDTEFKNQKSALGSGIVQNSVDTTTRTSEDWICDGLLRAGLFPEQLRHAQADKLTGFFHLLPIGDHVVYYAKPSILKKKNFPLSILRPSNLFYYHVLCANTPNATVVANLKHDKTSSKLIVIKHSHPRRGKKEQYTYIFWLENLEILTLLLVGLFLLYFYCAPNIFSF